MKEVSLKVYIKDINEEYFDILFVQFIENVCEMDVTKKLIIDYFCIE